MNPSNDTMDSAVMRIFRNFMVNHVGGRLSLRDVREAWGHGHFRRDDLDRALTRLACNGLLLPVPTEEGPHLELTAAGAHRIVDLPHDSQGILHLVSDTVHLVLADHRQPSQQTVPHNRRHDDPR